jgi:hypothetical protein
MLPKSQDTQAFSMYMPYTRWYSFKVRKCTHNVTILSRSLFFTFANGRGFPWWGFPTQSLQRERTHVALHVKRPLLMSDLTQN